MSDFGADQDSIITARIVPFAHIPPDARQYIKDLLAELEGLRKELFLVFKETCESNLDSTNAKLASLLLKVKIAPCPSCEAFPVIRVEEIFSTSYLDQIVFSHTCEHLTVHGPVFEYLAALDKPSKNSPTPSSKDLLKQAKIAIDQGRIELAAQLLDTVLLFGIDDQDTIP